MSEKGKQAENPKEQKATEGIKKSVTTLKACDKPVDETNGAEVKEDNPDVVNIAAEKKSVDCKDNGEKITQEKEVSNADTVKTIDEKKSAGYKDNGGEIAQEKDESEKNNLCNKYNKSIVDLTFEERLNIGIETAGFFADIQTKKIKCNLKDATKKLQTSIGVFSDFRCDKFSLIEKTVKKLNDDQRRNLYMAYMLFYVMSAGKYPQDCWKGVIEEFEETVLGDVRSKYNELAVKLSDTGYKRQSEDIKTESKTFQRYIESADVNAMACGETSVGSSKIFELFWEVFVLKYCNYSATFWKKKLTEYRNKKYAIREGCEFKEKREKVEIYAVSYEGKLDKPMHQGCEDSSFVTMYDENTWLAVSADGVGSCANSSIGSQLATEMLSETISNYLRKNKCLPVDKKSPFKRQNNSDVWAKLMYYLRFEMVNDFYEAWESAVKMSEVYKLDDSADLSEYTATLQFAFGCEAFIACGRVGDGSFAVRKRENFGNTACSGCIVLNDGISGVTQIPILTVAHLKNNPTALQMDFFNVDEITDIVISSDGVSNAIGEEVVDINAFIDRLSDLQFEQRCAEAARIARECSDYNETQYGSGDDSTLVYVKLK